MSKRTIDVISLSSDDNEEEVRKKGKREESVIELGSEGTGSGSDTVVSEEEVEEKTVDPRQRMRDLLAGAAERRIGEAKNTTGKEVREEVSGEKQVTGVKEDRKKDQSKATEKESPRIVSKEQPKMIEHDNNNGSSLASPIRLISNPEYCDQFCPDGNQDTVSMADLIGSPLLEESYQFNFMIDCGFILPFLKADCVNVKLVLVCSCDPDHLKLDELQKFQYQIETIDVSKRLPRYGSHHTKMMVNMFQDDTCQIVIHTMNLIETDYHIQTQMCWVSPRLKKIEGDADARPLDTGERFKRDLICYLGSYEEYKLRDLMEKLRTFDFGPVDVQFVGSSPGKYSIRTVDTIQYDPHDFCGTFGFGKLYQWIKLYGLDTKRGQLVGQVSAIASPFDRNRSNIMTHILTSVAEGSLDLVKGAGHEFSPENGLMPAIVWPTVGEVLTSHYSYLSGHALHMSIKARGSYTSYADQYENIRQFFYRWSSVNDSKQSKAGRSRLSPHVKTYCVTEDNFKTLKWFLLTSANMSSQAWGNPIKRAKNQPRDTVNYRVSSYEVGVLINPKTIYGGGKTLVPVMGKDKVDMGDNGDSVCAVRLPYDIPLRKYDEKDKPWTTEVLEEIYSSEARLEEQGQANK